MKKGNTKAVIIWDFDGVLFEIDRFRKDNRLQFIRHGVPEMAILRAIEYIRKGGKNFSGSEFARGLKKNRFAMGDKSVRRILYDGLLANNYYSENTDKLLHRLKEAGFRQMILSMGSAPYQRRKMAIGCGASFENHFEKIMVTKRPKYFTLAKIFRQYAGQRIIFIDDTKNNLDLVRKYVPGITAIYYSNKNQKSLKALENKIFHYAKRGEK